CCNSGNMSRGWLHGKYRTRYAPSPNYDAADDSNPPDPSEKKNSTFLMMSACQKNEEAIEAQDDAHNLHGAFSLALLEAFSRMSVNACVEDVFNEARA